MKTKQDCIACKRGEKRKAEYVRSDGKYLHYLCEDHAEDYDDVKKIDDSYWEKYSIGYREKSTMDLEERTVEEKVDKLISKVAVLEGRVKQLEDKL